MINSVGERDALASLGPIPQLKFEERAKTLKRARLQHEYDDSNEDHRKIQRVGSPRYEDDVDSMDENHEDYDPEINDLFEEELPPKKMAQANGLCDSSVLTPPRLDTDCQSELAEVDVDFPDAMQKASDWAQTVFPTPSPLPPPASEGVCDQDQTDESLIAAIDVQKISENIAEVKSRIISSHTTMTTYIAMRSAYVQVCNLSKQLTSQLALANKRISDLESRNSRLTENMKASDAKVDELKKIIRALPDQGEVLRNIARLEMDNIKKSQEIKRLRRKYGEITETVVLD